MHLWGSKKEEKPKKEGKPTAEELLKRHNCKTLTLEDGTKFILVGGTHSSLGGAFKVYKHYSRVKDFFDVLSYDAICMEDIPVLFYEPRPDSKFFKGLVENIQRDERLWNELNFLIAKLYSEQLHFARLLTGEEELTEPDFEYFVECLRKLSDRFELSERSREKLAQIGKDYLTQNGVAYFKTLMDHLKKAKMNEIYAPRKYFMRSKRVFFQDILLSKAIRYRKDVVSCGYVTNIPSLVLLVMQPFLGVLLLPGPVSEVYFLAILFSTLPFGASNPLMLSQKWGDRMLRAKRIIDGFFLVLNTPLTIDTKYLEVLMALQLLRFADDFKEKNGRAGTFLYFSHIGHSEDVLKNLEIGSKNRKELEDKLKSKKFILFWDLYREYIHLETSKLSEDKRKHFLTMAIRKGIPVEKL